MREKLLLASVQRQLDDDETAIAAVFLTRTHRWALPLGFLAGIVFATSGYMLGVLTDQTSVVAVSIAGAMVGALGATECRVLAATAHGNLLVLRGSRIRHVAREILDFNVGRGSVRVLSANAVNSQWRVGETSFMVTRRYQQAMTQISAGWATPD